MSTRPDAKGRFLFSPVLADRYNIHVIESAELVEILPVGPDGEESIQVFLP